MTRRLSVGVLVVALLFSGALVGVSFGGGGGDGITEPEVIKLKLNICGDPGPCRFYRFRDTGGIKTGQITVAKNPLFDLDGNVVGHFNSHCFASDGPGGETNWLCTYVHSFRASESTEKGTVVAIGNWDTKRQVFAVTGGTGAYLGVQGYTAIGRPGRYTLHLIP